jgi:hypothetical protein
MTETILRIAKNGGILLALCAVSVGVITLAIKIYVSTATFVWNLW